MKFSRQLAKIYVKILLIPLTLLFCFMAILLAISLYRDEEKQAYVEILKISQILESNFLLMESAENMIAGNESALAMFYAYTQADTEKYFEYVKRDLKNIQLLQYSMPDIYCIRIHVANQKIPEYWPNIYHSSRSTESEWLKTIKSQGTNRLILYNYIDDLHKSTLQKNTAEVVGLHRELQYVNRHVGYVQIAVKTEDFFRELFRKKQKAQYPFAFIFSTGTENTNRFIIPNATNNEVKFAHSIAQKITAKINGFINQDISDGSFLQFHKGKILITSWAFLPRYNILIANPYYPQAVERNILYWIILAISILALLFTALFFLITLAGDIQKKQELVVKSEVKAMQNQINAHFIYNVLETIKMQAILAEKKDIAQSLTLLGNMMRYCLRWRNPFVTVEQEIAYIQNYIDLLNIRNDYTIVFENNLPESIAQKSILKMSIQPIIENAVKHGIEPLGENATIAVSYTYDINKNRLEVTVSDSGIGIKQEKIDEMLTKMNIEQITEYSAEKTVGGIGLINIQERLYAFYGKEFVINITSCDGKTNVSIPFLCKEQ